MTVAFLSFRPLTLSQFRELPRVTFHQLQTVIVIHPVVYSQETCVLSRGLLRLPSASQSLVNLVRTLAMTLVTDIGVQKESSPS